MPSRVENDQFLATVSQLFATAGTKGSVYLEQKRLARTGADPKLDATSAPYPLIFRASDGARDKKTRVTVSTVVPADKLDSFWIAYTEALKNGMSGLKRKEKKKQRKAA